MHVPNYALKCDRDDERRVEAANPDIMGIACGLAAISSTTGTANAIEGPIDFKVLDSGGAWGTSG